MYCLYKNSNHLKVAGLSYGYSDGLNLTGITDTVTAANSLSLWNDNVGELTQANGPWGAANYSYGTGNNRTYEITTPSGGATTTKITWYPSTSNRMSSVSTNGTSTRSYSYDAAGNLTVDQQGSDTYTTTYNVRNRPVQVVRTGTASATSSYVYNGLEQMVTRTTTAVGGPTGAVYYYYDLAGNLIGEGNATAIQREYIWLPQDAGDTGPSALPLALVTAVTTTPVISMVHADHLNRPIRMTSSAKATVWSATWKPFGEPYALSGTIENNLRFPGQYFLIETGQAYSNGASA